MTACIIGDKEKNYLHCVRFYLPSIMKTTCETHKFGLGIFTMEGFEYKNTSKHLVTN